MKTHRTNSSLRLPPRPCNSGGRRGGGAGEDTRKVRSPMRVLLGERCVSRISSCVRVRIVGRWSRQDLLCRMTLPAAAHVIVQHRRRTGSHQDNLGANQLAPQGHFQSQSEEGCYHIYKSTSCRLPSSATHLRSIQLWSPGVLVSTYAATDPRNIDHEPPLCLPAHELLLGCPVTVFHELLLRAACMFSPKLVRQASAFNQRGRPCARVQFRY